MARGKRLTEIEALDKQIETVEAEIVKTKKKYDDAVENLKSLQEKKKSLQTEELLKAITTSGKSYDDILNYIQADSAEK